MTLTYTLSGSEATVDFDVVEDISPSHTRKIKTFDVGLSGYYVYDIGKSSDKVSMQFIIYNNADVEVANLRALRDSGSEVTLSGMDDDNYNDTYLIKSATVEWLASGVYRANVDLVFRTGA